MKAKHLKRGDVFRLHVYGEVLGIETVAEGKRVKVFISLENQGAKLNSGLPTKDPGKGNLEFTDVGNTLEFLCSPSRNFHVYGDDDGGDDRDDDGGNPVEPWPTCSV